MFSLYDEVLSPSRKIDPEDELVEFRRKLAASTEPVVTTTLGAPSQNGRGEQRTIGKLVRGGSTSPSHQNLLELLIEKYDCRIIYELGTSVGLTTLYLSRPASSKVFTFEGNKDLIEIARRNFEQFNRKNIEPIVGNIDQTLPAKLADSPPPDLVYVDANHRYEPTLEYTMHLIKHCSEPLICVIGDIYWSDGMSRAWKELTTLPEVSISIDLFEIGILFMNWDVKAGNYTL